MKTFCQYIVCCTMSLPLWISVVGWVKNGMGFSSACLYSVIVESFLCWVSNLCCYLIYLKWYDWQSAQYSLEHISHADENEVHSNVLYASPNLILNTTIIVRLLQCTRQMLLHSKNQTDSSVIISNISFIGRAHSFPWVPEFRAQPWILSFFTKF